MTEILIEDAGAGMSLPIISSAETLDRKHLRQQERGVVTENRLHEAGHVRMQEKKNDKAFS